MNNSKTRRKLNLKELEEEKKYYVLTDVDLKFEEGLEDEMYGDEQFQREIERKNSHD